jgi:tight adherence protein B
MRGAVIGWCDALAAELRAGQPVQDAVLRACGDDPRWRGIAAITRLSGDVGAAMRRTATRPGAEGLRAAAAAWEISARSGAVLAEVVERVAAGLRDEQEAAAEVATSIAPARATARMLAVLPIFGIGLGMSMGAQPVVFLLGTAPGLVCLTTGVLLALAGVFWVERLADRVELR